MNCNRITVFTPSFNRGYILSQLYESLTRQTDQNFEWIIVDDGSTDNTESIVNNWLKDRLIDITYIQQENQGKHIAINTGLENAKGELFFIVDSDDKLKSNAIKEIRTFWNKNETDKYSGILSYRQFPDGKLVGTRLPQEIKHCKLRDSNKKYGSIGDKVVIYRTDIYSRYKYPKFQGEKFFGESYVFNLIDDEYDMLVMDTPIYIFEYQPDGLSQNFRKLYRNNPNGMLESMTQAFKYEDNFKAKIKTLAHIGCLSLKVHRFKSYFISSSIPITIIATPLAIALYIKIFIFKASDIKPFHESEDESDSQSK